MKVKAFPFYSAFFVPRFSQSVWGCLTCADLRQACLTSGIFQDMTSAPTVILYVVIIYYIQLKTELAFMGKQCPS